jgi:carbonic anhydrase/acetyltransferase-like protein (isoleucine patch superfamily)
LSKWKGGRRIIQQRRPGCSIFHGADPAFATVRRSNVPLANVRIAWQVSAPRRSAKMAIFDLAGERPEFPADGQYWVAETAVVIGRVRLKSEASVWWNTVLRGDNEWIELGERSQIQDNSTLHTDPGYPLTIGRGCVIGHNVVLHGCTIGDGCLVGMGAIMMNGARIGNNCIVGAGAVVTEGKAFPDNSLVVGAPARVVRTLDEKAAEMIAAGADIYVRRWKHYARGLKRVG